MNRLASIDLPGLSQPAVPPRPDETAELARRIRERRDQRYASLESQMEAGQWEDAMRSLRQEVNLDPAVFERAVRRAVEQNNEQALQALAPLAPSPALEKMVTTAQDTLTPSPSTNNQPSSPSL